MMNHVIVNIGRSLGSGGYAIGKQIADNFGFAFYDKELLNIAAKESGLCKECFEKVDERQKKDFKGYFISSFSIFNMRQSSMNNPLSQDALFTVQSNVIKKLAEEKSCVFMGRCSDYILRNMNCCINIFCNAPMSVRIQNVSDRESVSLEEAEKIVIRGDSVRAGYYNYFTNKEWKAAESYHLIVDTSVLGIRETGDFLINYIKEVEKTF